MEHLDRTVLLVEADEQVVMVKCGKDVAGKAVLGECGRDRGGEPDGIKSGVHVEGEPGHHERRRDPEPRRVGRRDHRRRSLSLDDRRLDFDIAR